MATNLQFTKTGNRYECTLSQTEDTVIQVECESKETFTVYGYIDNLPPVSLYSTTVLKDLLFKVDVPMGVTVKLISWSPVISAKQI